MLWNHHRVLWHSIFIEHNVFMRSTAHTMINYTVLDIEIRNFPVFAFNDLCPLGKRLPFPTKVKFYEGKSLLVYTF